VSKESEPLSFLEKSHCVPIILALYRNGMMNRNQLYGELKETINVVIKRIGFLIDQNLIFERDMKVKPFAKYIGLTGKGITVAKKLVEIETVMETPGTGPISHLHIALIPDIREEPMFVNPSKPQVIIKNPKKEYKELIECPICGSERYLIESISKTTWICFKCGTKFDAILEDAIKLAFLEEHLQPEF
jgi:transposase-like protein